VTSAHGSLALTLDCAWVVLLSPDAHAATTSVTLPGQVLESSEPGVGVGDPVELTILYSENFVAWLAGVAPGVAGDQLLQAAVSSGGPIVDLSGFWTEARVYGVDFAGNELPPNIPPGGPGRPREAAPRLTALLARDGLRAPGGPGLERTDRPEFAARVPRPVSDWPATRPDRAATRRGGLPGRSERLSFR